MNTFIALFEFIEFLESEMALRMYRIFVDSITESNVTIENSYENQLILRKFD